MTIKNISEADYAVGVALGDAPQVNSNLASHNLQASQTANPENESLSRRLSAQTGVPLSTVRAAPDKVKNLVQPTGLDIGTLAKTSPATAGLLQDIDRAKQVNDDVENLSFFENVARAIKRGWYSTLQSMDMENLTDAAEALSVIESGKDPSFLTYRGNKYLAGRDLEDPKSREVLTQVLKRTYAENVLDYFRRQQSIAQNPASPEMSRFARANTTSETLSRFADAPVTISTEVVSESLGAQALYLPLALMGGAAGRAGAAGAALFSSSRLEYMNALKGIVTELGADINDPESVAMVVNSKEFQERNEQALIKSGVIGFFDATTAGFTNTFTSVATPITRRAGVEFGVQALGGAGGEVAGSVASGQPVNPPDVFAEAIGEIPTAAIDTAVGATAQKLEKKAYQNTIKSLDPEAVKQFNAAAAQTLLRERDPAAFRRFVEQIVPDSNESAFYLDPKELQQLGVDLKELAESSPSAAAQIERAMQYGEDIKISLPEYATHIAGTDLATTLQPLLKSAPEELSEFGSKEFLQKQEALIQSTAEKAMREAQTASAEDTSADVVKQDVLRQLNEAKRFTTDVNEQYATLQAQFFKTMASRVGVTPEQLYATVNPSIRAEGVVSASELSQNKNLRGIPVDENGNVQLTHFSNEVGLTQLDPTRWGQTTTALTRGERNRVGVAPGRSYFYGGQFTKEPQLGGIAYTTSVPADRLYDIALDPDNLSEKAREISAAEGIDFVSALEREIAKNYDGAVVTTASNGPAVMMYKPTPVEEAKNELSTTGDSQNQTADGRLRVEGDVRRGVKLLDAEARPLAVNGADLIDAPTEVDVPGRGKTKFGAFALARKAAAVYMERQGLIYQPPVAWAPLDKDRASRIAQAFEEMKHTPTDPEVEAAYRALIDETLAQYQVVKQTGLQIEMIPADAPDPYAASPRLAILDVVENNHLWVYPTDAGFGGPASVGFDVSDNPLLQHTNEYIGGYRLRANDVFRIVHDYFGHIKDGTGFRAEGEENAWQSHAAMFTPLARRALTTETRGQNSWLNFGPYGEKNRTAKSDETEFAPQKIGLLPEWVSEEGFTGGARSGHKIETYKQSAYHGTAHKFSKFSLDHIGTGEGAQAYGWGLYFADNQEVAEFYRQSVSESKFTIDGKIPKFRSAFAKEMSDEILYALETEINRYTKGGVVDVAAVKNQLFRDAAGEARVQGRGVFQEAYKLVRDARTITKPQGQLYKVEIPDDDHLLLWDVPVKDQTETVKKALQTFVATRLKSVQGFTPRVFGTKEQGLAVAEGDWTNPILEKVTGADIYAGAVSTSPTPQNESQRAVSLALRAAGLLGHKYWDRNSRVKKDGERQYNYVVYDDNAVQILETYYQRANTEPPRGSYNPETNTIKLFRAANLSTFLHESGHLFLETMVNLASSNDAPADIKADMETTLKWMGVGSAAAPRLDVWNTYTLEQKRKAHEKFARGFEAYLFEGKSPSIAMQSVFQKFRAWLLNVYKTIAGLNVEIDDEIRTVFDRMLASQEEIQQVRDLEALDPMFNSAKELGLDDTAWKEYQALGRSAQDSAEIELAARSLRNMQWLSGAKSRELRKLQRQQNSRRKAVREEVTAEVNAEPVYRALDFLRYGEIDGEKIEGAHRIAIESLIQMYGDEAPSFELQNKYGAYGILAEEGLHPDAVAEMFGFTSGDELVREIAASEDRATKIEGLTDQRMLERYGDSTSPEDMEKAANRALQNDMRARMVATELASLEAAVGKRDELERMAKLAAQQTVARTRVRELNPNKPNAAEKRSARAATEALRKGDRTTAVIEKRNQLLHNQIARETYRTIDEIEKATRYFKKLLSSGARENIDADYLDQIDALLTRFDFRKASSRRDAERKQTLVEWYDAQVAQGLEPDIDPKLLDEARKKSFKDMTVEELRGLRDAVKQIEHLGRLKNKLLTARDDRNFDQTVDAIVQSINENAPDRIIENRTRPTVADSASRLFKSYLASHRKVASIIRQLDGFTDGGVFWNSFVRTMNFAGDNEVRLRAEATEKLAKLVAPITKEGKLGGKGMFFPSIQESLNREERIAIAFNVGNAGNLQRLLDGEGWTLAQIQPVLDTLTEAEWTFVQNIWDFFEEYRPLIGAKEKRVYGKEPAWVEPVPVNTKFGTLRGGYYPIRYDPRRSAAAEQFADAEGIKQQMQGAFTSATTRRSFAKARANEVKGRPLLYSFEGLFNGANEVIHDLSWHEWLIDANKLLRNKRIDYAVRTRYGAEFMRQLKDALRDIAIGDAQNATAFEKLLGQLRGGTMVAGLGFNIVNSFINLTGITQSFVRVGPKWVARGLGKFMQNPKAAVAEMEEKSSFMQRRARVLNREVNEILSVVRGKSTTRQQVDRLMFAPMYLTQLVVDTPTWWGAYEKALAEGNDESKSVALADQAVIDAQTSGQVKDLSAIQRGPAALKLFTTFYGYFNGLYNLTVEQVGKTKVNDPLSVIQLGANLLLLYIVPVILTTAIKQAAFGGEDDEDKLPEVMAAEGISYLTGTLIGLREFTAAAQAVAGVSQFNTGYGGPAGLRFFNEVTRLGQQINQGEADEALRKSTINVLGILFKLPSSQINRTVGGVEALAAGETDNPLAVVAGAPRP